MTTRENEFSTIYLKLIEINMKIFFPEELFAVKENQSSIQLLFSLRT